RQAVLFHQVGSNLPFASVEPTGEDEQRKLEGRDVDHSPSLFRANQHRMCDGTVRAWVSATSGPHRAAPGKTASSSVSSAPFDVNASTTSRYSTRLDCSGFCVSTSTTITPPA